SLTTKDETLSDAAFDFTIKAESINTNVENRDKHLRSADFFDVEKHPTITIKSNKIVAAGKPEQYLLYGDLTVKGITKTGIFHVNYGSLDKRDKNEKRGLKAKTTNNRFDYAIDLDPAAAALGKDVTVVVHLQMTKQ